MTNANGEVGMEETGEEAPFTVEKPSLRQASAVSFDSSNNSSSCLEYSNVSNSPSDLDINVSPCFVLRRIHPLVRRFNIAGLDKISG